MGVLVVLYVGVTLVATPYMMRFVICCVDGYEWIAIIGLSMSKTFNGQNKKAIYIYIWFTGVMP